MSVVSVVHVSSQVVATRNAAKIIELDDLIARRTGIDSALILTKGTFDLLHYGHLELIAHCSGMKRGDGGVLVVLVESDQSVLRRKGPGRPIHSASIRLRQIASLESVDFAVLADFVDLPEIIRSLGPSVYVKGVDTAGIEEIDAAKGPSAEFLLHNPELAGLGPGSRFVVFTDDGSMSTSRILAEVRAPKRSQIPDK